MKSRFDAQIKGLLFRTIWLPLASFAGFAALGQEPEVVLQPSSQIPQSVLLSIRPHTMGWVLLQSSSDFAIWHPVVNLLTTNSSVPFVDYPASNAPVRFYRVRSPGVTAAEAFSLWEARRPTYYQYSFQNTKLDAGGVQLAGSVTISNGVKTVTNVTANGFPTTTFDPADFLTPEEVFSVIANAEASGVRLAHVTYDEQQIYPAAVVIIPGTSFQTTDYRMWGLIGLGSEGGQPSLQRPSRRNSGKFATSERLPGFSHHPLRPTRALGGGR